MAILADAERQALWAELMRLLSEQGDTVSLTKAELRAAVDAADAWADAASAAYNSALPQPARGALTARQKALLLMFVIRQRWEVL